MTRAAVFDLFETLVDYDDSRSREFSAQVAQLCGREPAEFHDVWIEGRPARETGPMAPYLASLGLDEQATREFIERRRAFSREILARPREGAVETLRELRARGLRVGLITVCSEDAVGVWPETPFAGLFDAEVFSCSCGLRKPDERIYRIALEQLGVEPREALFIGDGANDELAGAERVGMRAILVHRPGEEPPWPEVRDWRGTADHGDRRRPRVRLAPRREPLQSGHVQVPGTRPCPESSCRGLVSCISRLPCPFRTCPGAWHRDVAPSDRSAGVVRADAGG